MNKPDAKDDPQVQILLNIKEIAYALLWYAATTHTVIRNSTGQKTIVIEPTIPAIQDAVDYFLDIGWLEKYDSEHEWYYDPTHPTHEAGEEGRNVNGS